MSYHLLDLPIDEFYVELTNMCNFSCEFCPNPRSTRPKGKMELSLFKRIIDEVKEKNLAKCVLFHLMGEPLLHPDFLEAVKYTMDKGLFARLITNGSLLTEEMVIKLCETGLQEIAISLQTPDNQTFTNYRNTKLDFDAYYNTILMAAKTIHQYTTQTKLTIFILDTTTKRYFRFDRDFEIIDSNTDMYQTLLKITKDVYEKIDDVFYEEQAVAEIKKMKLRDWNFLEIAKNIFIETKPLADWGNSLHSEKVSLLKYGYCGLALPFSLSITWRGEVCLCCVDYDAKTKIGQLDDHTSIMDIIQSDKATSIMEGFSKYKIVHPYCQKCLGGSNKVSNFFKGLLSVYIFKYWVKHRRGINYSLVEKSNTVST